MEARDDVILTIDVLTNHLELQIESKSVRASCIRFYEGTGEGHHNQDTKGRTTLSSSYSIWSYSLSDTRKTSAVTFSKQ